MITRPEYLPELLHGDSDDPLVVAICETYKQVFTPEKQWEIAYSTDSKKQWLCFTRASVSLPPQGWKLHISANPSCAETILRKTLPLLLSEVACFKVAASQSRLTSLNEGLEGSSQVGKFITVFPRDDAEAVHLAVLLDEATIGLNGPSIPSDRVLHPGSLVYYRYGAFRGDLLMQTRIGQILPAILNTQGEVVPDRRETRYIAPDGIEDPFLASGITADLPVFDRLIGGKYVFISTLVKSRGHTIYLGSDLSQRRTCIIKGPGYQELSNSNELLQHESEVLKKLAHDPRFPAFFDLIERDGALFLIMEELAGQTLNSLVGDIIIREGYAPIMQILKWGEMLADTLDTLHRKNIVHLDLKPSNIIVSPDMKPRLIDFGLSQIFPDKNLSPRSRGTTGYMSPQRRTGHIASPSDDVYSFGVLLYFMLTGTDPTRALDSTVLLNRPPEKFHPYGSILRPVITRCLQEVPEARYASMVEIRVALSAIRESFNSWKESPVTGKTLVDALPYEKTSREILRTLCSVSNEPVNGEGLFWRSLHPTTSGIAARDVYAGQAGSLLAVAELAAAFPSEYSRSVLARGSQWLSHAPPFNNVPLPGLYMGEAGVGAALLRAGQILRDNALVTVAVERGEQVALQEHSSPDVLHGTAGRLRFHLFLYDHTHEDRHLASAVACANRLASIAESRHVGEVFWTIPEGYDELSGDAYLGYSHGAAGIADALLDLFDVTSDTRLLPIIIGAARWLSRQAIPALNGEGFNWPIVEGGPAAAPAWSHGAAGIGRFFLHAAMAGILPEAEAIAVKAAKTTALCIRWANPTQCHGLAGCIEFLLDMFQATGDRRYEHEAQGLASFLMDWAVQDGKFVVFPSEEPTIFTPDYMIGYAGVAVTLLRLNAPQRIPHQMSRYGFQYRPL